MSVWRKAMSKLIAKNKLPSNHIAFQVNHLIKFLWIPIGPKLLFHRLLYPSDFLNILVFSSAQGAGWSVQTTCMVAVMGTTPSHQWCLISPGLMGLVFSHLHLNTQFLTSVKSITTLVLDLSILKNSSATSQNENGVTFHRLMQFHVLSSLSNALGGMPCW